MRLRIIRPSIVVFAGVAIVGVAVGLAGPLDPPAGPIAPTYKTLSEIEPRVAINAKNTPGDEDSLFKITQPGSYYMIGGIAPETTVVGIEIAADNVTVDLSGFELFGGPGTLDGIRVTAVGAHDISVLNGTIRGWGMDGVDTTAAMCALLSDLRLTGNTERGINAGANSIVNRCAAHENLSAGIAVGANALVTDCVSQDGGANGFVLGNGSTVRACSSGGNAGAGFYAGNGCTFFQCTARSNLAEGIRAGDGCTIQSCTAGFNEGIGISLAGAKGASVLDCTVEANLLDGIRVFEDCRVYGNNCDSNGFGTGDGAGIAAIGRHNRIEANNIVDSDRGIQIVGDRNLVIRNSATDNGSNFVVAPGNLVGTIVTTEAAMNDAPNANVNFAF